MRTLVMTLTLAAALLAAAFTAPATAQGPHYAAPGSGWDGHPGLLFHLESRRTPVYYDRRRHYDGYVYQPRPVYRYRYPRDTYPPVYGYDPGAAVAAGIIGLATGAILGQVIAPGPMVRGQRYSPSDVAYCARRYRSFDPQSFTFLGYDGRRHYCRIP